MAVLLNTTFAGGSLAGFDNIQNSTSPKALWGCTGGYAIACPPSMSMYRTDPVGGPGSHTAFTMRAQVALDYPYGSGSLAPNGYRIFQANNISSDRTGAPCAWILSVYVSYVGAITLRIWDPTIAPLGAYATNIVSAAGAFTIGGSYNAVQFAVTLGTGTLTYSVVCNNVTAFSGTYMAVQNGGYTLGVAGPPPTYTCITDGVSGFNNFGFYPNGMSTGMASYAAMYVDDTGTTGSYAPCTQNFAATIANCFSTPTSSGTIVVTKSTAGADPTAFTFNAVNLVPTTFTLAHGASRSFTTVPVGSGYAVAEVVTAGWSSNVTVSNGSPADNITVGSGETVTVAFSNQAFVTTTYPLIRMRRFMLPFHENLWEFINRIEIVMKTGVGTSDAPNPSLRIRLSKDGGQTWAITRTVAIGAAGDYLRRVYSLRWGKVRNPVCEVCTSDPVLIGLLEANIDYDVGTA